MRTANMLRAPYIACDVSVLTLANHSLRMVRTAHLQVMYLHILHKIYINDLIIITLSGL